MVLLACPSYLGYGPAPTRLDKSLDPLRNEGAIVAARQNKAGRWMLRQGLMGLRFRGLGVLGSGFRGLGFRGLGV